MSNDTLVKAPIRAFLLAAFCAAGAAAAEAPLTLTVEDAVRMAVERSVDVELARRDVEIFEARYREAFGSALPAVTLSGGYARNLQGPYAFFNGGKLLAGQPNAMQAGVEVDQPLYTGGKLGAAIRGGRAGRERSLQELEQRRQDAAFQVRRLCYGVLLASATAAIQADTLASAEAHLRTIQERYRMGLDSDLAALRQEVEAANAKPALIAASNQVELGLILLKEALALDVDRAVELSGELGAPGRELPSYEAAERLALARRPELLSAHQAALLAAEAARVVQAEGRPQVFLYWDYIWQGQGQSLSLSSNQQGASSAAGLNLRFPLFSGGQVHERTVQANLEHEKLLEREGQVRRSVLVDIKRQWLSVREAYERALSQDTAIDQARRALRSIEVRYKGGQAGQLDLTDATLALERARTTHVRALADYWIGLAALQRASGAELREMMP